MVLNKFKVNGMTCGSCIEKVRQLLSLPELGFSKINVSLNEPQITFESNQKVTSGSINAIFDQNGLDKYKASLSENKILGRSFDLVSKLYPLFLVFGYLLITVLLIAYLRSDFSAESIMSHYMGGFFLIFSFFKFLNLKGFVGAFQTYDPVAKQWMQYGYFYAVFEFIAGCLYLISPSSLSLNLLVVILLSMTSLGVWKVLRNNQTIQCACLGTIFNLPMTYITIFENVIMITMASAMILYSI